MNNKWTITSSSRTRSLDKSVIGKWSRDTQIPGWWFATATGSTPPSGCGWAGKALSVLFPRSSHGSVHGYRCHWQWWVCLRGGGCRGAGSSLWEAHGADPSLRYACLCAWPGGRDVCSTDADWSRGGQTVPDPRDWNWTEYGGDVPYTSLWGWCLQAYGCMLWAWSCLAWSFVCWSAHIDVGG